MKSQRDYASEPGSDDSFPKRIPTGFRRRAQGCEGTELPWVTTRYSASTLKGLRLLFVNRRNRFIRVGRFVSRFSQCSDFVATLCFGPKSRWDLRKGNLPEGSACLPTLGFGTEVLLAYGRKHLDFKRLSHVSSHARIGQMRRAVSRCRMRGETRLRQEPVQPGSAR